MEHESANPAKAPAEALLSVRALRVDFPIRGGPAGPRRGLLRAVDGVDLELRSGRTLGIVGESGCGKTTLARTLCRLQDATGGRILYRGQRLDALRRHARRRLRREVQMIFQDPTASLNPRMTVERIVAEPLAIHRLAPIRTRRNRVAAMLQQVGLNADYGRRYPHELSGGQRQRVAIARALITSPRVLICDEPTSSLDVSVQSQILNLLVDIQQRFDLCMLLISHDLAVVEYLCHEVAVMYLGRIVEFGPAEVICNKPGHPYTRALLQAARDPGAGAGGQALGGELPSPLDPPSGCALHPRCPLATDLCRRVVPPLEALASTWPVACHHQDADAQAHPDGHAAPA